jgi:hypothetical protein
VNQIERRVKVQSRRPKSRYCSLVDEGDGELHCDGVAVRWRGGRGRDTWLGWGRGMVLRQMHHRSLLSHSLRLALLSTRTHQPTLTYYSTHAHTRTHQHKAGVHHPSKYHIQVHTQCSHTTLRGWTRVLRVVGARLEKACRGWVVGCSGMERLETAKDSVARAQIVVLLPHAQLSTGCASPRTQLHTHASPKSQTPAKHGPSWRNSISRANQPKSRQVRCPPFRPTTSTPRLPVRFHAPVIGCPLGLATLASGCSTVSMSVRGFSGGFVFGKEHFRKGAKPTISIGMGRCHR